MKFRNTKNWTDIDNCRGLLFFCQRVEELTFKYTIDSHRAPTTNAPYLIREVLKAIQVDKLANVQSGSPKHLFDEMASRLRDNQIVKSLLNIDLSSYLNYSPDRMDEVEDRMQVLRREVSPNTYALRCMELLNVSVLDSGKKIEIDFLARELITTLMNIGVSAAHINKSVKEVFFGKEPVEDTTFLSKFFRDIFPHFHSFTVVFRSGISLSAVKPEILNRFKIRLVNKFIEAFPSHSKIDWHYKKSSKDKIFFVLEDVRATDAFSAVKIAREKVARVHDLYGLFHHKQSYELEASAVVEMKCCEGEFQVIPTFVNNMQFISDNHPEKAALELEKMMKRLQLPSGKDRSKFFRVIDFHGMSSNSDIVENQLLNLWTAMETLVPMKRNSTKISSVTNGMIPSLSIQYIRRLFKILAFDLIRWDRRTLTSVLSNASLPDDADIIEKVFLLVCLPENIEHKKTLFARLKDFELLRFRIFQLNKAFAKPSDALNSLRKHEEKVTWQIHRIYRSRNAIIHSGDSPAATAELVAGAHDYFDQVFGLCLELCSGSSGFHTFQESFDFVNWLADQYRRELENIDTLCLSNYRKVVWRSKKLPKKEHFFDRSVISYNT